MIDANIKDGMVQKFWVYQNQGPSEDASEETEE